MGLTRKLSAVSLVRFRAPFNVYVWMMYIHIKKKGEVCANWEAGKEAMSADRKVLLNT
jgi:hypothetical protein